MRDNLRRYRAIRHALVPCYPPSSVGNFARHLNTLAALISGIVGSKSTHLPHIAPKVPEGGIHLRRDTLWHQALSAMAWCRFRGRGKSSICANTVSKRSGNPCLKNREAGVVPSAARQSKLCRTVHTL